MILNNSDECANLFANLLDSYIGKFTKVQIPVNNKTKFHTIKSWITEGLITFMKNRDRLRIGSIINPTNVK